MNIEKRLKQHLSENSDYFLKEDRERPVSMMIKMRESKNKEPLRRAFCGGKKIFDSVDFDREKIR
jgi:hypothetical protein